MRQWINNIVDWAIFFVFFCCGFLPEILVIIALSVFGAAAYFKGFAS